MQAIFKMIATAWRYSQGKHLMLICYVLMFVGANTILLLEPIIIGNVLNTIQQIHEIENPLITLLWLFAGIIGIEIVFWILHGPARVMEHMVAFYAHNKLMDTLYSISSSLPVQWHADNHSGKIINAMKKAGNALYNFMSNSFQGIEMVLKLIISIIAVTWLFPTAGLITIIICTATFTMIFLFDKILLPQYERINEHEHFAAAARHDYISNIYTVISLRLEELTRGELWKRMTVYLPLFKKNQIISETKWFLATMFIASMTTGILFWYAYNVYNSEDVLLAGTVYMLYQYLQKIGASFYTFAWKFSATVQEYADVKSVDMILEAVPASNTNIKLTKNWKMITIEDLKFSYEGKDHKQHQLDHVSITLKRGFSIAFVGESGSGKSTIMSLIRGLHTTDSANVTCDGKRLDNGLGIIANHTTLIPQEPEIFANTIEYNVSVDTEQAEESLLEDIESACFTSVLSRLPEGLKTDVSEKGVSLSGGEKQRLALARGIFAARKSDIVLLDEPTSSVDPINELQIHKNLFKRFKEKCVVASVHKLHLLPMFNYIYVMQDGKLVEEGTYDDLISKNSILGTMVSSYNDKL